jgi:hypothetical protein
LNFSRRWRPAEGFVELAAEIVDDGWLMSSAKAETTMVRQKAQNNTLHVIHPIAICHGAAATTFPAAGGTAEFISSRSWVNLARPKRKFTRNFDPLETVVRLPPPANRRIGSHALFVLEPPLRRTKPWRPGWRIDAVPF